jgi:hypothetical protein
MYEPRMSIDTLENDDLDERVATPASNRKKQIM